MRCDVRRRWRRVWRSGPGIILLAAEGVPNAEIARRVGVSRPTVVGWRSRYQAGGVAALADLDRPGRPSVIDEADVVVATLTAPPAELGVTHWSARAAGPAAGHLLRDGGAARGGNGNLQPWRTETFKFSTDPELDAKVRDVVGLYLNPPDQAVVSVWTRKARSRRWTGPRRSCRCGPDCRRKRPTTTSGTAPPACSPPWRSPPGRSPTPATPGTPTPSSSLPQDRREGLPAGQAACRRRQLRHPQTPQGQGLAREEPADHDALHPDLRVVAQHGRDLLRHHHPQAIRRGSFTSVKDLIDAIETPSSTPGTTAANPSSGPRPPTRSSPKPTVNKFQTRDTRKPWPFPPA